MTMVALLMMPWVKLMREMNVTPRVLADVAKIELLQEEEPTRIGAIWEAFHTDQPSVAGSTVGPEEAALIAERGGESPSFVSPLRREGGLRVGLREQKSFLHPFLAAHLNALS